MNSEYACDIIFDLLPLYLDGIVREETEEAIIEHLNECDNCRTVYEQMKCDISLQDKTINKHMKKSLIHVALSGHRIHIRNRLARFANRC